MRRAPALASLTVAALLAGFGITAGTAPSVAMTARAASLAPSTFLVRPDIADPLCNDGRGVRLPAESGGNSVVASATTADGATLIALTSIYPADAFAGLRSVTPACEANDGFGTDGSTTVTIPSGLGPTAAARDDLASEGLWVNAIAARAGGGAIVAGVDAGDWVVGELTASGSVEPNFGSQGWVVLPFPGEVSAILPEASGRILIAGNNGGGGCCTTNWAAALSEHGELESRFGGHGRALLPTGEDSGVRSLALEPDGDILADVGYGHMGCWGTALAMLTPSGAPVPGFAERLSRFWDRQRFGAFVGDSYVDGEGFTVVGTGQQPCYDEPPGSTAKARGLIAHFRADGTPAGRAFRFRSQMYGSVQAFHDGRDTFLAESPYGNPTDITLTALHPNGSTDLSFAGRGHAQILTPWHGANVAAATTVSIDEATPSEIVIVATEPEGDQQQLIRVRL